MLTVGIDEVGRGCWAGPVVAGAVILKKPIEGLKDSKLLSKTQREKLAQQIKSEALVIGLGWVEPAIIDKVGIGRAVQLAMERALAEISIDYDEIIIDGNINYMRYNGKAKALIKADNLVPAVSAASIVAKVARDQYMAELGAQYRVYEFAKHVGYGTALHLEMLQLHGVSDMHRKSYKPIQTLL